MHVALLVLKLFLALNHKSKKIIEINAITCAFYLREVSSHNSVIDELSKEHRNSVESLRTEKAILEVCCLGCDDYFMYV